MPQIRNYKQGTGQKGEWSAVLDAAKELMQKAHNAVIRGKESIERRDEEEPGERVIEKLREDLDKAADAAERYMKNAMEKDKELLEQGKSGSASPDYPEVEYVPTESGEELVVSSQGERIDMIVSPYQKETYVKVDTISSGEHPVTDPVRSIKTRETSSVREYHPSIKYADKEIRTSDTAGKALKAERAAEAERAAGKSGHAAANGAGRRVGRKSAGAAGRTAGRQSANAAGQAAASESSQAAASSAASSAAASSAAEGSAGGAAAGGWIGAAVIAYIIILLIAIANFAGAFMTYRMTGNDEVIPIRDAIKEVELEFQAEIDELRNRRDYDTVILEGKRAKWKDLLPVFFAETAGEDEEVDNEESYNFNYVSENEIYSLKQIFWEMTAIETSENRYTAYEPVETEDEDGNIIYEYRRVRKLDLTITVTAKTAREMAENCSHLNEKETEDLYMLLTEDYDELWPMLVYGYIPEDCPIVEVAMQEVGNIGGEKYWRWYGFTSHVEWCAIFVSWCANECGYISTGNFPEYANCAVGMQWFQERGQWLPADTEPAPGMIIFFDWDHPDGRSGPQNGVADHTGIVERVEEDVIYTIEGNAWDVCMENQYPVGHYEILGYGFYNSETD